MATRFGIKKPLHGSAISTVTGITLKGFIRPSNGMGQQYYIIQFQKLIIHLSRLDLKQVQSRSANPMGTDGIGWREQCVSAAIRNNAIPRDISSAAAGPSPPFAVPHTA